MKIAFEQFGTVERAVVICDSKGRSTCKGTVDFARKSSALKAVTQCSVSCINGIKIINKKNFLNKFSNLLSLL